MTTMNTRLKSLACGMGALAITAVLSWTFVQTTATVTHGTPTAHVAKLSIQHRHVRLGQFEPAVLVD
jgi:hypothetical protein